MDARLASDTWQVMRSSLTQLEKDSAGLRPATPRGGRVMSAGITLFPLRRNVFGRPWGRAELGMEGGRRRHWSGDAAEGERERERGRGSELRRPRAFICIPLSSMTRWERRRDAAATPSREPWRAPPPRGRGSGIRDATKILPSLLAASAVRREDAK